MSDQRDQVLSREDMVALGDEVQEASAKLQKLLEEVARCLVGHQDVAEALAMAMLLRGHVLIEGLPGLAKTTAIKAFAQASDLDVKRVQFTPDLLPADIIGTQIYEPAQGSFRIKKGPIFTHLLIADEINRAPAKVQAALLEAMQEFQVTIADETFKLNDPFLVMATQNPIEQEGTYPLPEAQMDRFLFKMLVHYGSIEEELEIMDRVLRPVPITLTKVISQAELLALRDLVYRIYVADNIRAYIVDVVFATRQPESYGLASLKSLIEYGASPRASINLERAARAHALIKGRHYVVPQDVKDVGPWVLRHRIGLSYEAEAQAISADQIVEQIFSSVDVP